MTLTKLTVFSGEDGQAELREDEIQFQSSDNVLGSERLKMSKIEPCKRSFFIHLPAGFHTEFRFVDREQTFVCLSGEYRISTNDGSVHEKGPGSVIHLLRDDVSTHTFDVLGAEGAHFLVVQVD
ncbi:MAG: hypothetical protein ABNH38_18025 [Tateyamaria sp.]|jgi:hypothetical protein|uniref:hypothetical protein n=1 Tax=Tateyamaria sp. TaxID=1929288 RepID=UPI0032DD24C7